MSRFDVVARRLANQQIVAPRLSSVSELVRWMGAVQAQDYRGGLWATGLRLAKGDASAIEDAIAARTVVRTWPMRGTLHFVPAEDARWMLRLLTPRIVASAAGRHRALELDDTAFARSARVLVRALEGGRSLDAARGLCGRSSGAASRRPASAGSTSSVSWRSRG